MKMFLKSLLALILLGGGLFPISCGKSISPTSTATGTGTETGTVVITATPTATVYTPSFSAVYQNSFYPTSSYSSESDAWLSGTSFATVENSTPYLEISTVASPGLENPHGYARTVIQFSGLSLPTNVTILGAEVWLTTETATNVSGFVTVGVHTFASSIYNPAGSSCMAAWTPSDVSWNGVGGTNWSSCDGSSGTLNSNNALFNPTPNSTVVFSSADNGSSGVFRFLLNVSDVQAEISSGTIQFILRSEGEFSADTGTSLIGFYPNTDTTGKAPKLLISYE